MVGQTDAATSEPTGAEEWRHVVSHSTLYALLFTGCLLIDAVLRTDSLGEVPHPIVYFLPSLIGAAVVGTVARSTGLTGWIDERVASPMVIYATLSVGIGIVWILR